MKLTGAPLPTSSTQKAASSAVATRPPASGAAAGPSSRAPTESARWRAPPSRSALALRQHAAEAVEPASEPQDRARRAKPRARNTTQPTRTNSMVTSPAGERRQRTAELLPAAANDQAQAVPQAPGHVGPAGAVPKPAQPHGDERREHVAPCAVAAAAERNVEIVAQEIRQRDVPAPPEVAQVGRQDRAGGNSPAAPRRTTARCRSPSRYRRRNPETIETRTRAPRSRPRRSRARAVAACANKGSADRASRSAISTFFAKPTVKITRPVPMRCHIPARSGSAANCGTSSLWRTIGPAIRCGNSSTNSANGRNG